MSSFGLAKVDLNLNGWKAEFEVLVAPPGYIRHTALLGRDVPGFHVTVQFPQEILPVQPRALKRDADHQEARNQLDSEQSGVNPVVAEDVLDLHVNKGNKPFVGEQTIQWQPTCRGGISLH